MLMAHGVSKLGMVLIATAIDLDEALQELEEDPEMRSKVALYRDPAYLADGEMTEDEEDKPPEVPLEELLDDLSALQLQDEGEDDEEKEEHEQGADMTD